MEAIGFYKSKMFETFSPIAWALLVIHLPNEVAHYQMEIVNRVDSIMNHLCQWFVRP
jgi:hypothetical protein